MSEIGLTNLTDLFGQLVHLIVNFIIYIFASIADSLLQIIDIPYQILSQLYNSLVTLISIIPDMVNSCFGWIYAVSPGMSSLLVAAAGIFVIHLIIGFAQLLWRIIPFT